MPVQFSTGVSQLQGFQRINLQICNKKAVIFLQSPLFSASVMVLGGVQIRVDAALAQQFLMGAALSNETIGNGHDPSCGTDGGQPVGNDEGGASLGQGIKCPLDLGFRDGVQSGGGFIQDEDGGFFRKIRAMATLCF